MMNQTASNTNIVYDGDLIYSDSGSLCFHPSYYCLVYLRPSVNFKWKTKESIKQTAIYRLFLVGANRLLPSTSHTDSQWELSLCQLWRVLLNHVNLCGAYPPTNHLIKWGIVLPSKSRRSSGVWRCDRQVEQTGGVVLKQEVFFGCVCLAFRPQITEQPPEVNTHALILIMILVVCAARINRTFHQTIEKHPGDTLWFMSLLWAVFVWNNGFNSGIVHMRGAWDTHARARLYLFICFRSWE